MFARKKLGSQTVLFENAVHVIGSGCVAGQLESQGPLKNTFDLIMPDPFFGEKTWEKAESKMLREAAIFAANKSNKPPASIDVAFAGDLLNQCISSCFALRTLELPFYGLFGACSTMSESLALGAITIDGGFAETALCGTSSHFSTAERQFRFPLEYGGKRTPTAQWTVTGSGMAILSNEGAGPCITHVTSGKVIDKGIVDSGNMGAAMAPAAASTLEAHFNDTSLNPSDYDLIVTGDLGKLGRDILVDLMNDAGFDLSGNYNDCGIMIFDLAKQDVACGGSGCGCSAVVLCGDLLQKMARGELNRILFVGTGALMSPTSTMQGESIPAIAHAVAIANR